MCASETTSKASIPVYKATPQVVWMLVSRNSIRLEVYVSRAERLCGVRRLEQIRSAYIFDIAWSDALGACPLPLVGDRAQKGEGVRPGETLVGRALLPMTCPRPREGMPIPGHRLSHDKRSTCIGTLDATFCTYRSAHAIGGEDMMSHLDGH